MNALQALYLFHVDQLYSYGMMLCQDSDKVRDAIQDLFLVCWTKKESISIPVSGKAYLMASLRRRIFQKDEKNQAETDLSEETYHFGDTTTPESSWIQAEEEEGLRQRIGQAMGSLSDRQREVLHMKYFQQLDYKEIQEIMGLNYQSARNLVNRALLALRKELMVLVLILTAWM